MPGLDDGPRHLRRAPDDDRLEARHELDEIGLVQARLDRDIKAGNGLHRVEGLFVHGIGDQDFLHCHLSLRTAWAALTPLPASNL